MVYLRASSVLQIPDAVPSRGGGWGSLEVRWLRGRGAAMLSSQPHAASRGGFPRKALLPSTHTGPHPGRSSEGSLSAPGPTPPSASPRPLPTPTQVAVPRGGGGSRRGPSAGLSSSAVACPSFPELPPAPRKPGEAAGGRQTPSPGPPSCPARGAAGPPSRRGKSSRLRVGHRGFPWVLAWLKGEA